MFRTILKTVLCLLLILSWVQTSGASRLVISSVYCDTKLFRPGRGQNAAILYNLSAPAVVTVNIYDSRDILVRQIKSNGPVAGGPHQALWDGRDQSGKIVPGNFYLYTIKAEANGETVVYDPSDITGGKAQKVLDVHLEKNGNEISYVLTEDSIVNIRLGLKDGGPLLKTLIDWVPRTSGLNKEPWDGWDNCHTVNLADRQKLQINVNAYSLPMNSIIVNSGNRQDRPAFISEFTWNAAKRTRTRKHRKEMYNHWQHPRDKCYDPRISILLPGELRGDNTGIPVVSGRVPIQMKISGRDRKYMMDQRFEVVYYLDFVFIHEEELGYSPFTWVWNTAGVNRGIHYITVMLRGYEGHFGTATRAVKVGAGH